MKNGRSEALVAILAALTLGPGLAAQNPPPAAAPPAAVGQRGGGRAGRGAIQVLALSTTAWPDGGRIPLKYTQPGRDVSPPLAWSEAPAGTASFALLVHDLDAAAGNGSDDVLHWLVWNIPGAARALREGMPQGPQLPDGTRQISVTGPYYRGPAAPASGPAHHYLFELYALDTMIDVAPVGPTQAASASAAIRAAVVTAMAGHVRGKGLMVGVFRRAP